MTFEFKPHSIKQNKAIFSDKPIVVCATGIQYGKSTIGAVKAKIAMHTFTNKSDNFIITAPTYKIMQQATLPAFLKIMEGYGTFSKVDAVFHMHNGGTCYFRTGTDPDSVVGITDVRFIWGDEAGLYSLYFHENIQARASFKQAQIVYTTSPYSMNWVYKDFIRPFHRGLLDLSENEVIQARSDENPFFPKAEFERKKRTMDPKRFNMVYGGEFSKLEGLVYSCFDEELHVVDEIPIPLTAKVFAGVDWGYTNPSAICVIAYHGDKYYLIHEFYKSGKTITDLVQVAKALKTTYGIERFFCDPSSPANIQEFNRAGLTAIAADNDIRSGVDTVFQVISGNRFRVFRDKCPHFIDEMSMYHYRNDDEVKHDKDIKEQMPVKQHDHMCDSFRYCINSLEKSKYIEKKSPTVPGTKQKSPSIYRVDNDSILKEVKQYDW